jgi:predicted ferric reductase
VVLGLVGVITLVATDQIVPPTSERQAALRFWLAARATGLLALLLLTLQVALGLVLSHPTNKSTWKLSKRLFPWHEDAWIFVLAFLAFHVIAIVTDRFAGVGLLGAVVPGLSSYRSPAVALGTLGLYSIVVTGLTARYTKRLPPGAWLKVHRVAIAAWALVWAHGLLSGTDSVELAWLYGATFAIVIGAAAYRYWVSRQGRPSFSTSPPSPREVVAP